MDFPESTKSDLPLGPLNSYATRIAYDLSKQTYMMISAAEVKDPEPHDSSLKKIWRYSGSVSSIGEELKVLKEQLISLQF